MLTHGAFGGITRLMDKDDPFDRLRTAAASGRRSTLYRWMMRNHERFSETLAEAGRPNWEALAATFDKMGLKNRDERQALTGPGVRQTWRKVKQAPAKAPIKQTAASPAAPILQTFNPATDTPFPFEAIRTDDDDDEPKFHDLKGRPL